MFKENTTRAIALGIVIKDNKILVEKGHDKVKNIDFYRCLGGGIEKDETPIDAVKREFKEEIDVDIKPHKELGVINNKFIYNGKQGHEIVHLIKVSIDDDDYAERYNIVDDLNRVSHSEWIDIEDFKSEKKILFPSETLKFL